MAQQVLFIDRDGTLIREPADYRIDSLAKLELLPGVITALRQLQAAGYRLVIVSNQDGLGSEEFPRAAFELPHQRMLALFAGEGVTFEEVLIDHHREAENHPNRKPNTGMVLPYLARHTVDLRQCYMIGDRKTDALLAANLGIRSLTIKDPLSQDGDLQTRQYPDAPTVTFQDWASLTRHILYQGRVGEVHRQTKVTDVRVRLVLHGAGHAQLETGIGFLDHALEEWVRHSGVDLELRTVGDLDVDEHHSVEDSAVGLGQAFAQALALHTAPRSPGARYGFSLPLDDTEAHCLLELSGRPYLKFKARFARERVGELPTELVEHFFHTLCLHAGLSLHLKAKGDNDHHQIVALFRAFGLSLRMALTPSEGA